MVAEEGNGGLPPPFPLRMLTLLRRGGPYLNGDDRVLLPAYPFPPSFDMLRCEAAKQRSSEAEAGEGRSSEAEAGEGRE